jgi:hypothetical protein
MNLARAEALFWKSVRSGAPPPELDTAFVARQGLDVVRRMGIYRSAYWTRQLRVLEDSFARVLSVLGRERFRQLALAYIADSPSSVPGIEMIGQGLPEYLARSVHALPVDALDLARLEWATLEALLAPDALHTVTPSSLQREDLPRCRVVFASHVRLLRLSSRAVALFREHDGGGRQLEIELDREGPVWVAVWRGPRRVEHVTLNEPSGRALYRAQRGAALAHVCTSFTGARAVDEAFETLAGWLRRRWLVGLEPMSFALGETDTRGRASELELGRKAQREGLG